MTMNSNFERSTSQAAGSGMSNGPANLFFDNNPLPMWVYDLETYRFLAVNHAAEVHYGWSKDEFLAMTIKNIRPNQDVSRLVENVEHITEGLDEAGVWRHTRRDGSLIYVEIVSHTLEYNGRRAELVVAIDVTERMRADNALRAAEEKYRNIFEKVMEAIHQTTVDGRYLAANPATAKILGFDSPEELMAERTDLDRQFYVQPGRREEFKRLMEKNESISGFESEVYRRDGSTIWITENSRAVRNQNGDLLYYEGTAQDITERKQAEERINRHLKYLMGLRDIDRAITSTFDLQISLKTIISRTVSLLSVDAATILLINPVTNHLEYGAGQGFRTNKISTASVNLGESYAGRAVLERHMVHIPNLADEPGNRFLTGFFQGEDFVSYDGIPLIVKGKAIGVLEVFQRSIVERDEEWFDFLNTLAGQAAIAIDNARLWEQTQRHTRELERRVQERTAELNQANLELEFANKAKDEFLATMSHELRTPLNSILGLSESLLEQRRDPLSEHQQKSLQIVRSSGQHLLELINDVLDLSKIEAGKFEYHPQVVDVNTLCRSGLSFVKEQALRKSITLNYPEDDRLLAIYADPRRLKQILVNLLTNAVKFTPEHGVVDLQVHANAEEDLIQFSVKDSGIGIAHEDMKKLFQPFVQVDSSLTREYEGTGLGLALVQRLTDLHGGSVHVESEVGRGSRFTISIPWGRNIVAQQEAIQAGTELTIKQTTATLNEPLKQRTILLAEDNMSNILTVGDYLETRGYQVVIAHDGLETLEKAGETHPDIILMDIQMPQMDGLEATRRLRTKPEFASVPIIALTALAMPGDRERCLEAGANEYMSKPVSLKGLLKTIENLLQHKNK